MGTDAERYPNTECFGDGCVAMLTDITARRRVDRLRRVQPSYEYGQTVEEQVNNYRTIKAARFFIGIAQNQAQKKQRGDIL